MEISATSEIKTLLFCCFLKKCSPLLALQKICKKYGIDQTENVLVLTLRANVKSVKDYYKETPN